MYTIALYVYTYDIIAVDIKKYDPRKMCVVEFSLVNTKL